MEFGLRTKALVDRLCPFRALPNQRISSTKWGTEGCDEGRQVLVGDRPRTGLGGVERLVDKTAVDTPVAMIVEAETRPRLEAKKAAEPAVDPDARSQVFDVQLAGGRIAKEPRMQRARKAVIA